MRPLQYSGCVVEDRYRGLGRGDVIQEGHLLRADNLQVQLPSGTLLSNSGQTGTHDRGRGQWRPEPDNFPKKDIHGDTHDNVGRPIPPEDLTGGLITFSGDKDNGLFGMLHMRPIEIHFIRVGMVVTVH